MDPFDIDWASSSPNADTLHLDLVSELQDHGFEPQTRARSNTWPCPRPLEELESVKVSTTELITENSQQSVQNAVGSKKNSSRRNAWGNLSYADLITHAIGSTNEKRLTLSQIYEWMVQNVPYFKDKGDSNSSAGWKNSIRHNLSLHNRFMRIQNEGTGKSSWWMLNPDAKPGKSVRRRAASMETSRYEKKRGRAKKRVEAMRISGLNDAISSPSSSVSEGLDHFPDSPVHSGSFQLSPDFRQRASSNASSCGRLSPIPSLVAMAPNWNFPVDYQTTNRVHVSNALEQLAGSIRDDLTLQKEIMERFNAVSVASTQPPVPYQSTQQYPVRATVEESYGILMSQCELHSRKSCTCLDNTRRDLSSTSANEVSINFPNNKNPPDSLTTHGVVMASSNVISINNNNLITSQQTEQQLSLILDFEGRGLDSLNNQEQIDELNIDNFHGGLECNIEELIQQEMSIDGLLDINIPLTTTTTTTSANQLNQLQLNENKSTSTLDLPQSQTRVQYSQANVTPPSWVH